MTQSPQSGQGAPPRSEFGSVTAPAHPSADPRDSRATRTEWGAPPQGAPTAQAGGRGSVASAPSAAPFDSRTTTTVPAYNPPPGSPAGAVPTTPPPLVSGDRAPLPPGAPAGAPTVPPAGRPARGSLRNRGPRRARLQLRHINPWTVLKFSCVLSIALFFVWLIVVGILFGVLDAAGVISKLNDAYIQVNPGSKPPIRAGIVFGGAAIIGAVNIILFIALSTVGAVVYNLCADLVGGVEITLSER